MADINPISFPPAGTITPASNYTVINQAGAWKSITITALNNTPTVAKYASAFVVGATDNGLAKIQSSNGITLGNTANANSTVLDYYDEGTWTPVGNNVTLTSSNTLWTRIGRVVVVVGYLAWPTTSNTDGAQFAGLPFTVKGSAGASIGYASTTTRFRLFADSNTTVYAYDENGTFMTNAQLSAAVVRFTLVYTV